jgi:hypothetical protein
VWEREERFHVQDETEEKGEGPNKARRKSDQSCQQIATTWPPKTKITHNTKQTSKVVKERERKREDELTLPTGCHDT